MKKITTTKKYERMNTMLVTLSKSIALYQKYLLKEEALEQEEADILIALRDSLIKHFEYCADHSWKYVSFYLTNVSGLEVPMQSPKDIFRLACKTELLTTEETEQALEMIKVRNHTTHIYKEEFADIVAKQIPGFYYLLNTIIKKMSPEK